MNKLKKLLSLKGMNRPDWFEQGFDGEWSDIQDLPASFDPEE